jgi:hypothetical protein
MNEATKPTSQKMTAMAKVIIGVHGLGNKPDKEILHEWWRLSLMEGLQNNGYEAELPHFEMVYWADVTNPKPLDVNIDDENDPLYIRERYTPSVKGFTRKENRFLKWIMRYLGKQLNKIFLNEDFTLKHEFIPDFIVRRYFKDLDVYYRDEGTAETPPDEQKKEIIKKRLADCLEKHKDSEIMLIAHSMGSIIAFDVLSFITPHIPIHTFITIGSPLGLPLVVGKIAAQYKPNPDGEREMLTPPGIHGNWFNFSDMLDKITFNYQLSRKYQFNKNAIRPRDFAIINDYHSNSGKQNPHKSFGYLRTAKLARMVNYFIHGDFRLRSRVGG